MASTRIKYCTTINNKGTIQYIDDSIEKYSDTYIAVDIKF